MVDFFYRTDKFLLTSKSRKSKFDDFVFDSRKVGMDRLKEIIEDRAREAALHVVKAIYSMDKFNDIFPEPPDNIIIYHVTLDHTDTTPILFVDVYLRDADDAIAVASYIEQLFGITPLIETQLIPDFGDLPLSSFWSMNHPGGRVYNYKITVHNDIVLWELIP